MILQKKVNIYASFERSGLIKNTIFENYKTRRENLEHFPNLTIRFAV